MAKIASIANQMSAGTDREFETWKLHREIAFSF